MGSGSRSLGWHLSAHAVHQQRGIHRSSTWTPSSYAMRLRRTAPSGQMGRRLRQRHRHRPIVSFRRDLRLLQRVWPGASRRSSAQVRRSGEALVRAAARAPSAGTCPVANPIACEVFGTSTNAIVRCLSDHRCSRSRPSTSNGSAGATRFAYPASWARDGERAVNQIAQRLGVSDGTTAPIPLSPTHASADSSAGACCSPIAGPPDGVQDPCDT